MSTEDDILDDILRRSRENVARQAASIVNPQPAGQAIDPHSLPTDWEPITIPAFMEWIKPLMDIRGELREVRKAYNLIDDPPAVEKHALDARRALAAADRLRIWPRPSFNAVQYPMTWRQKLELCNELYDAALRMQASIGTQAPATQAINTGLPKRANGNATKISMTQDDVNREVQKYKVNHQEEYNRLRDAVRNNQKGASKQAAKVFGLRVIAGAIRNQSGHAQVSRSSAWCAMRDELGLERQAGVPKPVKRKGIAKVLEDKDTKTWLAKERNAAEQAECERLMNDEDYSGSCDEP
ncbi:MAG TPA: hypothetical protein VFC78_01765 [Tepidisphaeraceae bacterium]|nr:hypothetical protein [Tepidisphaeraceae bacterium]